jgi:hypothetical protein
VTVLMNDLLFVPKKASDLRFVPISQNLGGSSMFFILKHNNKKLLINLLIKTYLSTKEVNMSIETRIFYLCYTELIYRLHKIFR